MVDEEDEFEDAEETTPVEVDAALARRVLRVVGKGLTNGMGRPVPGEMCVEAAVCYAAGEPHSDYPACVASWIRRAKIEINDHEVWMEEDPVAEKRARARGLRRLSVVQLGSVEAGERKGSEKKATRLFAKRVLPLVVTWALSTKENAPVRDSYRYGPDKPLTLREIKAAQSRFLDDRRYTVGEYVKVSNFLSEALRLAEALETRNLLDAAACWVMHFVVSAVESERDRQSLATGVCEVLVGCLADLKFPGAEFLSLTKPPKLPRVLYP